MLTPKATIVACQASWFRPARDRLRGQPQETGTVPAGSMITNSVTKTSPKNFTVYRSLAVDPMGTARYRLFFRVERHTHWRPAGVQAP